MAHQEFQRCIEACNECAVACSHCATACLHESDVRAMARCIALDLECADICRLAAASMARGDEHARGICTVCAEICQACGDECARHPMDHCRACAESCRRCAEECRRMSQQADTASAGKSAAHTR